MKRLTKSQYNEIAKAISISAKFDFDTSQEPRKYFMVHNIADYLAKADNQFDRQQFLADCGIEPEPLYSGISPRQDEEGNWYIPEAK